MGEQNAKATTVQIVQRLLSENRISAEEAVTLLTKEKEYVYYPYYNKYPYWTSTIGTGGTMTLGHTTSTASNFYTDNTSPSTSSQLGSYVFTNKDPNNPSYKPGEQLNIDFNGGK